MKIKFDKKKGEWIELEKNSKAGIYIDGYLYDKLKNVKKIQKKGFDCPIIIDGGRRDGKSVLGMTIAWILSDEKLILGNFAIGINDAIEKIKKLPDRSILFVDEGSMVFNSKDAMAKEVKQMIKILDIVGQKEMIFIIILPSFFDLLRPIAIRISRFLLHVYTDDKMNRGSFSYFGKKRKKLLYILGKKNYDSYDKPKADFIGSFTNFHPPFYEEYLKHKKKTLYNALDGKDEVIIKVVGIEVRKEIVENVMKNKIDITRIRLSEVLGISPRQIGRYLKEINEKRKKEGLKTWTWG